MQAADANGAVDARAPRGGGGASHEDDVGAASGALLRLFASAASGLVARCFVHPMDTIRTRIMASRSTARRRGGGIAHTARQLLSRDGVRGFYRGFGVTVAMQAPAVATFLTTYDVAKAALSGHTRLSPSSPAVHLACGFAAEAVSAVFWVPMEVLKQRTQLRDVNVSAAAALRDLLRHEGATALFRGYGATLAVFGPYSMLYFTVYEWCKARWCGYLRRESPRQLPTSAILASAAVSGGLAAAATTPLDVVKTRLQTQEDVRSHIKDKAYRSVWDACGRIVREEGAGALARGMAARVLWIMPQTAITMSTFELLKKQLKLKEIV